MSHTLFQRKLIKHFDICFKHNKIVWPQQQEKSAKQHHGASTLPDNNFVGCG